SRGDRLDLLCYRVSATVGVVVALDDNHGSHRNVSVWLVLEAAMSEHRDGSTLVRHFRQILLWPMQLAPLREGAQIQGHWELLERAGADNPWGELRDEFSCAPGEFKERH